MNLKGFGLAVIAVLALSTLAPADTYVIDKAHSRVGFMVRHLMISKVQGYFKDFSGMIEYDEKDPAKSSVKGTIKVASIDTNNENRDEDLRTGEGFFEASKYPEITFESKKVMKKGDGWVCLGTLTMHGVSKDIELPFTITGPIKGPGGLPRIALEASTTINRQDWGLTWSNKLDNGNLVVSNEVTLTIDAEAVNKGGAAQTAK